MLDKLRIANYRFTLKARDELHLPPYKGSTLRGVFGHAFKSIVCAQRRQDCAECLLRENCPYAYVFETSPPQDSEVLRTHTDVPLPFVLEPPLTTQTEYEPGQTLTFDLILVGKAIDLLAYFVVAFQEAGRMGIGRGRGRFALQQVETVPFDSGSSAEAIYIASRPSMIVKRNSTVRFEDIEKRAQTLADDQVSLKFLTPARIKHDGHFISQPPFHVIIRNVLRRVSSLYYFHCGEQWEFDYRGTIERAKEIRSDELNTRWVDWERYSGRQNERMKLGGFVGETAYKGDLSEFRPLLLLGQLVHIGKACVFGNGRYEVR